MGLFSRKKKVPSKTGDRNSGAMTLEDAKKAIDATHMAVYGGMKEYMIPFMQESRDVTLRNEDGNTLLHTAVEGWQFEMVEFLILSGADVNAVNNNGDTPLTRLIRDCKNTPHEVVLQSMAVTPEEAREKTIELLRRSADLSIRNASGANALELAANFGDAQALKHLLIRGRDLVNVQSEQGMTPLAYAALFDHPECVKLLLLYGADPWQIMDNQSIEGDFYPLRFMVSSEKPEMKAIVQDIKDKKLER